MKKKNVLIVLLCAAVMFSGCGSNKSDSAAAYYNDSYVEESAMMANDSYDYSNEMVAEEARDYEADGDASVSEEVVEDSANQGSQRMLIKTVNMSVESENVDSMVKNIENKVNSLGGYVENLNIYNDKYSSYERKTANLTARIPVEKLDMFVVSVEGQSNVLSKNSNAEDVTLRYVDMQSRMDSYQTEYDRISALLEKADDLDTIIGLEARLTDLRYQIESYGSQLKVMKNQASYSTVNIDITQVIEYTPVVIEEQTRLQRMVEGFVSNCKSVGNGILDFFVGLIIALPVLAVWAIIITIIVLIVRAFLRCGKNKNSSNDTPKKRNRINRLKRNKNVNVEASDNTASENMVNKAVDNVQNVGDTTSDSNS